MVLEPKSPSIHNKLRSFNNEVMTSSSKKIPHPASTRYDENESTDTDFPTSTAKRRRIGDIFSTDRNGEQTSPISESNGILDGKKSSPTSPRKARRKDVVTDVEQDEEYKPERDEKQTASQLETALPPIQTDEEAIEAYEAYRAAKAEEEAGDNLQSRLDNKNWIRGKSSIYVDAFNLALDTVLQEEGHLFDEAERTIFNHWQNASYEVQYLYVRLFLRKTSAWFRISRLGYYSDIGDMDAAVAELQKEHDLPETGDHVRQFPGEAILPEEAQPLGRSFTFAECSTDHIHTLDEASSLLLLDELKVIAKDAKVQGKTKRELLQNLRRTSGKQTGLGFKRSDTEETANSNLADDASIAESEDDSGSGFRTPTTTGNRDAHYTKKILEQTGKCIRLSLIPLKLFERVHLVFYRSTEWTEKSLTTLVLAGISRRVFPQYIVSRSANIFESRPLLLEFEASLRTQFKVDNYMEISNLPVHKQVEAIYSIFEAVYPRWKVLLAKEQEKEDRMYETGEGASLRRFSPGWVYTRIVHKGLWPLARLKEHKREHEILTELLNQRLFHAARRGAWYQRKALLEEHYMFALTDSNGRSEEANKKHWKRIALKTCEQGLEDKECHVIYHYDLQKRVLKLEKQLKIPKREQHDFGHVDLNKARERDVEGIQIIRSDREDTPSRSSSLRRKDSASAPGVAAVDSPNNKPSPSTNDVKPSNKTPPPPLRRSSSQGGARGFSTKTTWLDELDTNEHVSVEAMCLSHYRRVLGYKGYHSEGGIIRTLFGLLFYDILFEVYVPNVFQTAYQMCPLDLHTDAFYSARISEINVRINELAEPGAAEQLIRRVWEREFPSKTCVIGVRWEQYELEDLCEIVRCFEGCGNGGALGVVMRVMAQEYASRGGGVPDLFLWKVDEDNEDRKDTQNGETKHTLEQKRRSGTVMFAEVKSENDRLSDTQRLWISVLLNAGIEVELCHAIARETRPG